MKRSQLVVASVLTILLLTTLGNAAQPFARVQKTVTIGPGPIETSKFTDLLGVSTANRTSIKIAFDVRNVAGPFEITIYSVNQQTGDEMLISKFNELNSNSILSHPVSGPRPPFGGSVDINVPPDYIWIRARGNGLFTVNVWGDERSPMAVAQPSKYIYKVVPLKATPSENAILLSGLGKQSWELVTVFEKSAFLKYLCPQVGAPADCN